MQSLARFAAAGAVAGGLAIAIGCGGSSTTATPTTSGGSTPNATTFVLQGNAITPKTLTVPRGTQVTILNSDSIAHEMDSDPHPEHTDCPELNEIDFLNPGQSRQSGNLNIARSCGFHDHMNPDNKAIQGTIIIQ